ncbi:DegT/DnrJ/EryC1/StrS family aminotransferase [Flavicella sediminum]|uniref:DegT/DnrJ/EryC1/StrS family aminotransferase n=1 Tax=Flavicella sediminum TaxID=2585141 RepID=UPI00111D154D|nr:DegT/DnrJ/EryC1/StrS family aminotransferase [Flavicella sediminum]
MIKFNDLKKVNQPFEIEFKKSFNSFLQSGWYIKGKQTSNFEKDFAAYCGTQYCLGVGNGLDALKIIFKGYLALGRLQIGDEILVPANTYIATILAITETGLSPILIEPDSATFNINPALVQQHISPKTKGILAVHLYGQLANMETLQQMAKEHKLLLLEDAAQAHGAMNNSGQKAGNLSNAAGFSFYPSKNLGALGDGGAITTNDDKLYQIIKKIANYGSEKKDVNTLKGINSRLDEIQAAFLSVKLKSLEGDNDKRRAIAAHYLTSIKNPKLLLPKFSGGKDHVFHIFTILTEERDNLKKYLLDNGIESMIHYPTPPHKQQAFQEWNTLNFPITEQIHKQTLSIPLNPILETFEIEKIINTLNRY